MEKERKAGLLEAYSPSSGEARLRILTLGLSWAIRQWLASFQQHYKQVIDWTATGRFGDKTLRSVTKSQINTNRIFLFCFVFRDGVSLCSLGYPRIL